MEIESKINKYNRGLYEKLVVIDERSNRDLKRKTSKNLIPDDTTNVKKTLTPFTANLLQSKIMDRSTYIPKSATLSQKLIGIF